MLLFFEVFALIWIWIYPEKSFEHYLTSQMHAAWCERYNWRYPSLGSVQYMSLPSPNPGQSTSILLLRTVTPFHFVTTFTPAQLSATKNYLQLDFYKAAVPDFHSFTLAAETEKSE